MKHFRTILFSSVVVLLSSWTAHSQGTAFTYQGRLSAGGNAATGNFDLMFSLHAGPSGAPLAGPLTNLNTSALNGYFTVILDFGPDQFDGGARWLEIAVRTNGGGAFTTLAPRQMITAAPYAITAGDVTSLNVARLNVSDTSRPASGTVTVTSGFITGAIVTSGGFGYLTPPAVTVNDASGSGAMVTATVSNGAVSGLVVNSAGGGYTGSATLSIAPPPNNAYQTFAATNFFSGVNTLTNTANILGGNGALIANLDASRLASGTLPSDRFFGLYTRQVLLANSGNILYGDFIGDGASLSNVNAFRFGGMTTNNFWLTSGNAGTTAGNFLGTTDSLPLEFRVNNQRVLRLEDNGDSADGGTIPDGAPNIVGGSQINFIAPGVVASTISGGGMTNFGGITSSNLITADLATIAGGHGHEVRALAGTVSGGARNMISNGATSSSIGGGGGNSISAGSIFSRIGGGSGNLISTNATFGVVAGGQNNHIQASTPNSVISGGNQNIIGALGSGNFIGGGLNNAIRADAAISVLTGGEANRIGTNAYAATVSGGYGNQIHDEVSYGSIGGGLFNHLNDNTDYSTVAGGQGNSINADTFYGTIGGGTSHSIGTNANYSTIAGGNNHGIGAQSSSATIGGGGSHLMGTNADFATIAGGSSNVIEANSDRGAIGGGSANNIHSNASSATISGGSFNEVSLGGDFATIPGGYQNEATNYAFAAGLRAKAIHRGAFVWADAVNVDVYSTNHNTVTMRAIGGYRLYSGTSGGVYLGPGSGTWASLSDRHAKENFEPVNSRDILEKVAALPLSRWNYKEQPATTRHIGPMAQDFRAAFGVGENEKTITTIDADGVALAAIQGLNQKLQEELKKRDLENMELRKRLEALEKRVR